MIADMNFHDLDSDNPHVHIMLSVRPFNKDGTWGDKQRKVYHFDENGDKIYDPVKRQYKCSKEQTTDWNERHKAEEWRASWADMCNAEIERLGHDERIDHRSFERQGINQIPTIHLGTACHQMEQRGLRTERGDINRAIKLANAELQNINAKLQELESELQQLQDEIQQSELQEQETPPQEKPSTATPKQPPTTTQKSQTPTTAKNKVEASTPKTATPKTNVTKNANTKTNPVPISKSKPKTAPTHAPKPVTKPTPKPRTLKEVDLELNIIESKLSGLKHASDIDMLYGYKIQDIERNLSSAGFFERLKMNKEIARQEKLRSDFHEKTVKEYGTESQLKSEKSKLLAEKTRIENATGVTAAREAEQQRKRDEVIQRHQDRDRYNAERKAKRLENPSVNKSESIL